MEENPTLSEAVFNSISDWFANSGEPAMLTGFVLQLTAIDTDGSNFYQTIVPNSQLRPLSLGLVAIADESIREDLRTDFMLSRIDEDDD